MRSAVAEPFSPPGILEPAAVADVALGLLAALLPDPAERSRALRIPRDKHALVRAAEPARRSPAVVRGRGPKTRR